MNTRDYDTSINLMDMEVITIIERLQQLDASSDEYDKTAKNLKTVLESQQIEEKNRTEHRSALVPQWGIWACGAALSVALALATLIVEQKTGMPPIQGLNFWDKFRPKIL